MKWTPVKKCGVVFFLVTLLLIALHIVMPNYVEDIYLPIPLTLAGVTLGAGTTLMIVEYVIEKDRERQWETVKTLTYTTIMAHICRLTSEAPLCIGTYTQENIIDTDGLNNKIYTIHRYAMTIADYENSPREDVAKAIKDLSKSIDVISEIRRAYLNDLLEVDPVAFVRDMCNEAKAIKFYYDTIQHLLEEIRNTLIPRALQLSSDQKVNEALLRFEKHIRIFEDGMRSQQIFDHKIPNARNSIAPFLKEAGILYDIMQHELL